MKSRHIRRRARRSSKTDAGNSRRRHLERLTATSRHVSLLGNTINTYMGFSPSSLAATSLTHRRSNCSIHNTSFNQDGRRLATTLRAASCVLQVHSLPARTDDYPTIGRISDGSLRFDINFHTVSCIRGDLPAGQRRCEYPCYGKHFGSAGGRRSGVRSRRRNSR